MAKLSSLRRLWTVLGLAAIAAGCGGNSCSCAGPIPNGFPPAERVDNSMQVRVSESALTFFENNATTLVSTLIPGGLTFQVPPSCGDPDLCCASPCGDVVLDLDPRGGDLPRLELNPNGTDALNISLRARVRTTAPHLQVEMEVCVLICWTVDCEVTLDTERSGAPDITVNTTLNFSQDPTTGTTRADLGAVSVTPIDDGDVDITGGLDCSAIELFAKGTFVDAINDNLAGALTSVVGDQFCKSCAADAECAPWGPCDTSSGICMIEGTTRCQQEIGLTGRMTARSILGSMGPTRMGATDFYDVAGGYAQSNNAGLSLGFLGGAVAGDGFHDSCVPAIAPPAVPGGMLAESAILQGNVRPDNVAFDIGIGLHEYFLDRFFWALYDSGSMCANVGEATSNQINSATFRVLAPSMDKLFHGQVSKIFLLIRPKQAPDVTLGAGTFTQNGSINEPLMTLSIPKMGIDIYAQVDERFVRLLTIETDVAIPLGLLPDGMGQLLPVLGDLADAFTNVTVTNSELLAEPPLKLAAKIPFFLSIAIDGLAGALDPIALPLISGLALDIPPDGITSIDNNTMLAIFADLAVAMHSAPVDTTVEIRAINVPDAEAFTAKVWDPAKRPTIELAFAGNAPEAPDAEFEWQVRVDDTTWSPFTRRSNVLLSRAAFWLQARHKIEVRARIVGVPRTTDPESAVVYAIIDTIAPTMELLSDGQNLVVNAKDMVSKPDRLLVEVRMGEDAWTAVGQAPATIAMDGLNLKTLQVRVTDEAGNVGVGTGEQVNFHSGVPADDGCNCTVGHASRASQAGSGLAVLTLFWLLMLAISRGRRLALHLLVLVAVTAPGCNCSKNQGGLDPSNLPGVVGRYNDSAAIASRVLISTYDQNFGDLVVIELDPAELTFDVVSVDGVPDGPVVDPEETYRGGVTAKGDDVGPYSSILMVVNQARIAYKDADLGGVRFASERAPGEWEHHLVDDGASGEAGFYNSLAANSTRTQLGIAYLATGINDGNGGKTTQLRWARALTPTPRGPTDWTIEVVTEAAIPCAGFCGDGQECVAASNTCQATVATCISECVADIEACIGGACTAILPAPTTVDIPEGTGLFASAGFFPDDRPVIAYYDRNAGDLMIAVRETDSTWTITAIDSDPMTDVGQWASMVVDPMGALHIAYQDAGGDRLLYAKYANGAVVAVEVIDDGARAGDRSHPVGASVELLLEAAGPLVIYQDQALSDVMTATRNSDGAWTTSELLAGPIGYGFYISAISDGTDVWVANYFYDATQPPPGRLGVVALP